MMIFVSKMPESMIEAMPNRHSMSWQKHYNKSLLLSKNTFGMCNFMLIRFAMLKKHKLGFIVQ